MPAPASNQDELLLELLRRKGILADQRNLRLAPFSNSSADDPNGANGAAQVPAGSGAAPTANGVDPTQPIDNGDGTFTDPATGQVVTAEQAKSIWPALLGGAAGAAMGYAASEMLKRGRVPTIEDEVVDGADATARVGGPSTVVEGEYTDVAPSSVKQEGAAGVLADRQRRLTGPKQALPSPKASDITPEELQRANAIADELVKSRLLGNANPKKAPKRGVSTGPLNRESLLEGVIAAIRKAKLNPSTLARAIP